MDVYSRAQFYCVFREVVGVNAACNSPFIRNNNNTFMQHIYKCTWIGRTNKKKKRKKKVSEWFHFRDWSALGQVFANGQCMGDKEKTHLFLPEIVPRVKKNICF